jgi:hypothetical protein
MLKLKHDPIFRSLVLPAGKLYCVSSRFPETAATSLGVFQPWPLPSSRPVSPRKQAAMVTFPRVAPLAALLQRVREKYRDMPGLSLTKSQAMLVFGVAPSVSAAVLRALVMQNVLSRTGDGAFVLSRTADGERAHSEVVPVTLD